MTRTVTTSRLNWASSSASPICCSPTPRTTIRGVGDFDEIHIRPSAKPDTVWGMGMSGRAIRTRQPVVWNDFERDRTEAPWRAEALKRGFHAGVALPILVAEAPVYVLVLYSEQAGVFDQEEMHLLNELAGDIGFSLDYMEKAQQASYLALYDALTGLANRTLFTERTRQQLQAAAADQSRLAVLAVDLDRFRVVNETLGLHAGDTLLKLAAKRLQAGAPDADDVARLGADTFALLLRTPGNEAEVVRFVEERLLHPLSQPFLVSGHELRLAARCGIAFSASGADAEALLGNAQIALKRAKDSDERVLFYVPAMHVRLAERLTTESRLRRAVEEEQFVLHYQPKIDLTQGAIVGLEALIRWNDPQRGLVPPGEFISVLEETGLILQAGRWALEQAAADFLRWLEVGRAPPRIAVNVSQVQLRQQGFVTEVLEAIERGGRGKARIELEITESMIMQDIEANIVKLRQIREAGMEIALDDFGTGYSSLSYIAKLPLSALKIDRSFVISLVKDPNTMAIVSTTIALAHGLKLKVVAEGVDDEEQARLLRLLRCDEAQGYLFWKPLPAADIEKLLAQTIKPMTS